MADVLLYIRLLCIGCFSLFFFAKNGFTFYSCRRKQYIFYASNSGRSFVVVIIVFIFP